MRRISVTLASVSMVLVFGCGQPTRDPMAKVVLHIEEAFQDEDGLLLTFSNGLPRPVRFYEITPDLLVCQIQFERQGQWTSVNPMNYCMTGRDTVLVKAGGSHRMKLPASRFSEPWRIGMTYWEVLPDGFIHYEVPLVVWSKTQLPTNCPPNL